MGDLAQEDGTPVVISTAVSLAWWGVSWVQLSETERDLVFCVDNTGQITLALLGGAFCSCYLS